MGWWVIYEFVVVVVSGWSVGGWCAVVGWWGSEMVDGGWVGWCRFVGGDIYNLRHFNLNLN